MWCGRNVRLRACFALTSNRCLDCDPGNSVELVACPQCLYTLGGISLTLVALTRVWHVLANSFLHTESAVQATLWARSMATRVAKSDVLLALADPTALAAPRGVLLLGGVVHIRRTNGRN